jgi:hypothetical protein
MIEDLLMITLAWVENRTVFIFREHFIKSSLKTVNYVSIIRRQENQIIIFLSLQQTELLCEIKVLYTACNNYFCNEFRLVFGLPCFSSVVL